MNLYKYLNISNTIQAYVEGIRYPKYLLITYGWYSREWWKEGITYSNYTCTAEERASILAYSLAPRVRESYTDLTAEDDSGIVSNIISYRYYEILLISLYNVISK